MIDWDGLIVVVFGNFVQVFWRPQSDDADENLLALCNISLGLPDPINEVKFHRYRDPLFCNKKERDSSLYIFARQSYYAISFLELQSDATSSSDWSFKLHICGKIQGNFNSKLSEQLLCPYAMAVGVTGSAIAWCGIRQAIRFLPPSLMLTSIDGILSTPSKVTKICVPKNGLPMLHHFPIIEFDDGRGIIVLGTSIGELAIIRLKGSRFYAEGCLDDQLPIMRRSSKKYMKSLSVSRTGCINNYYMLIHANSVKACSYGSSCILRLAIFVKGKSWTLP